MMGHTQLFELCLIPISGVAAQWMAWRFRIPTIIFLLSMGFLVGPFLGLIHPDTLLGHSLHPFVSLAVALIVFEGALGLKLKEVKAVGGAFFSLISIGAFLNWLTISFAAYFILSINIKVAVMLGALLVVTGPTVILPLLKDIKLKQDVASIVRWEGIVIDSIGATMAVLVYEIFFISSLSNAFNTLVVILGKTFLIGGLLGVIGAFLLIISFNRGWVPEFLQEVVTFVVVITVFLISNLIQAEAGLLAVTAMGICLANQQVIVVKHIITFKENLSILLISSLFIILSAQLNLSDLKQFLAMPTLIFIAVLVVFARPMSVFVSTLFSSMTFKDRLFISWMAPRGIVAAAIASLFAIKLTAMNIPDAEKLLPITLWVIITTVLLYGLTGRSVARFLGVVDVRKQGLIMVGCQDWSIELANILQRFSIPVLLIDTNKVNVLSARSQGVQVIQGSFLSKEVSDEVEFGNYSRLLALTSNDEINLLAVNEFTERFGKSSVYRLWPVRSEFKNTAKKRPGQLIFSNNATFSFINTKFIAGSKVKAVKFTKEYTFQHFKKEVLSFIPFFLVTRGNQVWVASDGKTIAPEDGQTLIALVEYR